MTENSVNPRGRIDVEVRHAIGWITIENLPRHNALTLDMWRALPLAVERLDNDGRVRAIVVTGGQGGPFASGADIAEFDSVRATPETSAVYEAANAAAFSALRRARRPTIALVRSFCMGGGLGIAAACDVRLAASDAVFAIPAARLGLAYPPDAVGDLVNLIGPSRTRDLFFTARRLLAEEALRIGLVDHVAAVETFAREADDYIAQLVELAPLTLRAIKSAVIAVLSSDEADRFRAIDDAAACFASADYAEGIAAFREKRTPRFHSR